MTTAEIATLARQRVDRIKTAVEVTWQLIVESFQARDWEPLGYGSWDEMCTREFGTSRLRLPREERAETVQSLRDAGLSIRAIAAVTGDSKSTIAEVASRVQIRTPEPLTLGERARLEGLETVVQTGLDAIRSAGQDVQLGAAGLELVDRETGEILDAYAIDLSEPEGTPEPARKPVTGLDGKTYHRPSVSRKPPRKPLVDVAKTRGFALRQATESLMKVFEDDRYRSNEKQVADVLRGHLLYVAETVAAVIDQLP